MKYESAHAGEFAARALDVLSTLSPKESATVVALSGELGAGKTTFVQTVARALGVTETVASPTFVIQKSYPLSGQKWKRLIHIDAYRLKGPEELEHLGWHDIARDKGALVLLEWPERVLPLIPESALRVRIDIRGDGRIISTNGGEETGKKGEE